MEALRWTKEELDYLENNWGIVSVAHIARTLNRTENAVISKAEKLGLGSCYESSGDLSAGAVARLLKIDAHTVINWIRKYNLKAKKKALIKQEVFFIKLSNLIEWLKNNQKKWDSRKLELYGLGTEPEWLKEKRKKDLDLPKRKLQKWTKDDDSLLISYMQMGKSQAEIGELLQRTRKSVQKRLSILKGKGIVPKNILIPWTEKEDEILLTMDKQGKTDKEIAWELGRDVHHVRDHRRNLRNKGLYPRHKKDFTIDFQTKQITGFKKQGKTYREIADKLNIHPSTVYRRLKLYS